MGSEMCIRDRYSIKYFSLLDHFHTTVEVQFFFILTSICFFFLILGYHTRIFQFLSAIGLISIHNAAVILENGGDMVFNNYLVWTLFLPLGASWSIDSMRKSLKTQSESNSNDLNQSQNADVSLLYTAGPSALASWRTVIVTLPDLLYCSE